jgi:FkbH-like protein
VNLIHALEILKEPLPEDAPLRRVFLASSFTPLHLKTFLAARLRSLNPGHRVQIKTGTFGDLPGSLERLQSADFDALAIVIEWQDLDARLGIRSLGGWRSSDLPDILESVSQRCSHLERAITRISPSIPACVCMPTLPLPPLFSTCTHQAGVHELQLRHLVASIATTLSKEPGIRIVNAQRLDELSPSSLRFDVKSEITTAFPYKLAHASIVAELLAALVDHPNAMKGLITDLDDTLWAGILGEVGVQGISWDLDHRSHMHGLYQQFLASLGSVGILIGVASKNDPDLVEQAFNREDLLLPKDSVFPFEVRWSRKSESIQSILKIWNISSSSVVFIDDSPMEAAEVSAAFPDMRCIVFPNRDYPAIWELVNRLRDMFGKTAISEEDKIRLRSIRNAGPSRESGDVIGSSMDDFLQNANSSIRFAFCKNGSDARALELINKTNQFNLNGRRFYESAWMNYLKDPPHFILTATYEDKYGPLGKIAVLMGSADGRTLLIDAWVMSCRAFSRRIEHQVVKYLFEQFDVDAIAFDYRSTDRNGPVREFFTQFLGDHLTQRLRLSRTSFFEKTPPLFHRVEEENGG